MWQPGENLVSSVKNKKLEMGMYNRDIESTIKRRMNSSSITQMERKKASTSLIKLSNDVKISFSEMVMSLLCKAAYEEQRSTSLLWTERVWEPGGISAVKVHREWFNEFYSCDRSLKLMKMLHKTRVREVLQESSHVVERSTQIAGILSCFLKLQVGAPAKKVAGKRLRDPGQFSKKSQCGVKSEQDWWRFRQTLIIQNHETGAEVRTRKQSEKKLRDKVNGNNIETRINILEIYVCECKEKMMLRIYQEQHEKSYSWVMKFGSVTHLVMGIFFIMRKVNYRDPREGDQSWRVCVNGSILKL